jgi:hypothetical protein
MREEQVTATPLDRSSAMAPAVFGMLSGGVAWALLMLPGFSAGKGSYTSTLKGGAEVEVSALSIIPGVIFGLIIGFLWHRRGKASARAAFGYALASGIAYFLAFHVAFNMFDRLPGVLPEDAALVVSGVAAGVVGCCLLGVASVFLFGIPYRSVLGLPVLIGGAAGALLPLINVFSNWDGGFLIFLTVWQGAYAASLAPVLRPAPTGTSAPPARSPVSPVA